MAALLRRSAAGAVVATLATVLVPTAVSLAAPAAFAASGITTDPAPSSGVVAANRPTIIATFNAAPASGSINLTEEGGNGSNLCGTPVIDKSAKQVRCQPTADLDTTKKYDAVGSATDSSGSKAKTSTLTFTVDYPVLDPANSNPIPNGTIADGGEDLTAAFNEAVTGDSKADAADAAFKLFEVNADGSRGVQLPGAISFGGNPVQGSDGTVTFNPNSGLANGRYEVLLLVNGVSGGKANPKAIGRGDYSLFVNNNAPFSLNNPVPTYNGVPYANTSNNTAFPFSGFAAPGLTINVTVKDPKDPNPLTNTYKGSGTVDPCPSAPSCPFTVTVDISQMNDGQSVTWTAQGEDANQKTTQTGTGPSFAVDYSKPNVIKTSPDPAISNDSKTVTVNATDSSTDVVSYLITITDPEGNKITPKFPAQNNNLPATPIDVTTLDDGELDIFIQAVDNVGNVSDTPGPPQGSQPYTVTKNVGLQPNLGTSILTSNGTDTTFVDAETGSVQPPTKVTVGFTQSVKLSYTDDTKAPPATHNAGICITTQNGNCLVSNDVTLSSDKHSLSMKVSNPLPDGVYGIHATAFSAGNCPDKTPVNANTWSCDQFDGIITDPNTGQPFHFTIDTTKPTISITDYPNPVTASNEKSVTIKGVVSKTTQTVSVLIFSSGNTSQKQLFQATIMPRANTSDPDADWSAGPLDLSNFPDGTLTIKATAKKSNGLSASVTKQARMQAHLSNLTETPSKSKVTYGHPVAISGHLTDESHNAITGADITVRPKFASGHFGRAVTVVTNSGGGYTAHFKPRRNATYYATYDGAQTHDGATVHTAHVGVRFHVTITSPTFGAHVSSPVTVKGRVGPSHAGAIVTVFRHTSSGNTVVGKGRLDKQSRFSVQVVLPPGTDVIYASVGKTKNNLAGKSKLYKLHVS